MIRAGALFVALLCAGSTAAGATQPAPKMAPLPEGLATSSAAKLRGLYATSRMGGPGVEDTLDRLAETCGGRLTIQDEQLRYKGQRQIYRTSDSLAVYEDVPAIDTDEAACAARVSLRRTIKGGTGPWRSIRTDDWSTMPSHCSGPAVQCRTSNVDGIEAICVTIGDPFQGSVSCSSRQRDLSEGLLLSFHTYLDYDDGNRIEWSIGAVDVDALIDPVVFASFRK